MRTFNRLSLIALLSAALAAPVAHADQAAASGSVSIKADVQASGQSSAATGDALYAKGELEAALVAYGEGFAESRDAAFIYAMARCHESLGHAAEAKAMFEMYLSAQGSATLKYESE